MDYRIRWQQQRRQRQRRRLLIVPAALLLALALFFLVRGIGGGGDVHWVHHSSESGQPHFAVTPSLVLTVWPSGHVWALRTRDGGSVTASPFYSVPEAFNVTPTVANHVLYVGSDLGILRALDARTGQRLWDWDTGGAIRSQPLAHAGRLYVGNDAGRMYCFGQNTKIWSVELTDSVSGQPAVVGDLLIVATVRGVIHALKLTDGRRVWRQELQTPLFAPVTAAPPLAVVGSDAGHLHVLEAATGKLVAQYYSRGLVRQAAAVGERTISYGSTDGWLRVISRDGKQPLWAYRLPGPITAGPVIAGGRLYVASPKRLVALNADTGRVVRSWKGEQFAGDLAVTAGAIYLATTTGSILALVEP